MTNTSLVQTLGLAPGMQSVFNSKVQQVLFDLATSQLR